MANYFGNTSGNLTVECSHKIHKAMIEIVEIITEIKTYLENANLDRIS